MKKANATGQSESLPRAYGEELTRKRRVFHSAWQTRAVDEWERENSSRPSHAFSASGHELAQAMLAINIRPGDAVFGYYRSKCTWFTLGLSLDEYCAGSLQRVNSFSNGRDIPIFPSKRNLNGVTLAPSFGAIGSQFEPAVGWARSIRMSRSTGSNLQKLCFVIAGDGAVASSGFWSAVRESATQKIPLVIVIENNGIALSTGSKVQCPGGQIAPSLASFEGISVVQVDGRDPDSLEEITLLVQRARRSQAPCLLEIMVDRQFGHQAADPASYRTDDTIYEDPLARLSRDLETSGQMDTLEQLEAIKNIRESVDESFRNSAQHDAPRPSGDDRMAFNVGARRVGLRDMFGGNRVSMGHAINCWIRSALRDVDEVLIMGEDIGTMGGVHGVTRGLRTDFPGKVIDTALNESCIIGQALGLALAGYYPIVEIQYRKFLDLAMDSFSNIGRCAWLTSGEYSPRMIIRMPCGPTTPNDPWHSESDEATILRTLGFTVAYPSTAADAIDAYDLALQGNTPTVILESQRLYYSRFARSFLPVKSSLLKCPHASVRCAGSEVTLITWGGAVPLALQAAEASPHSCEVIDLCWLAPWDKATVFASVTKTTRCMIIHEDRRTLGFGAELAATIAEELWAVLESPPIRIAGLDQPTPVDPHLVARALPSLGIILQGIGRMMFQ